MEFSLGLMEENMKGSSFKTRKRVMAFTLGQMVANMMANGKKEDSMELVSILQQQRTQVQLHRRLVIGKTVKELNGSSKEGCPKNLFDI